MKKKDKGKAAKQHLDNELKKNTLSREELKSVAGGAAAADFNSATKAIEYKGPVCTLKDSL